MLQLSRRPLLAALAFGLGATAASTARAAERAPWTDAAFAAAQAAGRPLIVEVTAPWCPTCRAQAPHVTAALAEPALASALLLTVDFDSQKDALRRLGVRQQSTIIAFNGSEERGRIVGVTDAGQIRELIRRAV
jgi:thiol:disulfide interchange protein